MTKGKVPALGLWATFLFKRVRNTEGLIDPRPEDGASGPPKFQPIGRGDEKTREVNPFPFPRCVAMIITQGKTCFKNGLANIPSTKNPSKGKIRNGSGQTPKLDQT